MIEDFLSFFSGVIAHPKIMLIILKFFCFLFRVFTDFKRYYSLKDRISNIPPSSLSLCGKSMHPPPSCGGVIVTGSDQWSGLEALGLDSRPGIH